jgi:hypothetical protein
MKAFSLRHSHSLLLAQYLLVRPRPIARIFGRGGVSGKQCAKKAEIFQTSEWQYTSLIRSGL